VPPLIRVEKNFFKIGRAGYQKNRNFVLIPKMCRSLEFGKRDKLFYRKTELLGTQEFYTFLKSAQNSASFDTLQAQFRRNFFKLL
jgi:hypothetical protein